jgi:hypothetical protein
VIDSHQVTAKHKVSTPVHWHRGEDVIIAGSVSDEQAARCSQPGRRENLDPHRSTPARDRGA